MFIFVMFLLFLFFINRNFDLPLYSLSTLVSLLKPLTFSVPLALRLPIQKQPPIIW